MIQISIYNNTEIPLILAINRIQHASPNST